MLQLNKAIIRETIRLDWPSPFIIAKCIRCLTYPIRKATSGFKTAGKAINWFSIKSADSEAEEDQSELNSAEEWQGESNSEAKEALDEYQKMLENTFNNEEYISEIMDGVQEWADDL